jgi:hypothetical protein
LLADVVAASTLRRSLRESFNGKPQATASFHRCHIRVMQTPEKISEAAGTFEYARASTTYDGSELYFILRNYLVEFTACREHPLIRSVLTP